MNDMSETDSTTDISQSSTEDSGIHTSFGGGSRRNLNVNRENSQPSCSDVMAELFQSHKRLREAETQIRSLSLILGHGNDDDEASTGIDQAVFRENKSSLEQEIMKIKQDVCEKELVLQQRDMKLFESYLGSIKDEKNSKLSRLDLSINDTENSKLTWSDVSQNESVETEGFEGKMNLNGGEYLTNNAELETLRNEKKRWKNDEYFENSLDKEHEIAKLRRTLADTKQKHKEERDDIMKQLKALQITTVQCETNWRCVLKEKQLKIDELTRKNSELQTKHAEVSLSVKNCEKLKQKEGKASERRKNKDEKIILSLRTQNSKMNEEMKQLSCEVQELRNSKQELNGSLKQLTERNKKLEKDLWDKSQFDEKNRIIEEYSKEINETNMLVNKLVLEVNCLSTDKENLEKEIEEIKTKNLEQINVSTSTVDEEQSKFENSEMDKCSVDVGIQTEESAKHELQAMKAELELKQVDTLHLTAQLEKQESFLECLKEKEIKLQKECETWKNKSLQNER